MGLILFSEVAQGVSKFLQVRWDLQTSWRPQSSGKIERADQTLKRQISKFCRKCSLNGCMFYQLPWWELELVHESEERLLKSCMGSHVQLEVWKVGQMHRKRKGMRRNYLLSLSCVLSPLHRYLSQWSPLPLDSPVQNFQPGDCLHLYLERLIAEKSERDLVLFCWPLTRPWKRRQSALGSSASESKQALSETEDEWRGISTGALKTVLLCHCIIKWRVVYILFFSRE